MSVILIIGIVGVCIVLEAFFSGSEMAIISYDRIKLKTQSNLGAPWARKMEALLLHPERLLGTTLVGTNLSTIIATTALTIYITLKHGPEDQIWSFIILSPLILVFGEILPKMICHIHGNVVVPIVMSPIYWMSRILFRPFVEVLSGISRFFLFFLGRRDVNPFMSREELRLLIDVDEKTMGLKSHQRRMIRKIFSFTKTIAVQTMKPLIEVMAAEDTATVSEVVSLFKEGGYSRLPVYRDRIDNIIGVVHSFDVLRADPSLQVIKPLIKPVVYASENQPIDQLLVRLQKDGEHMAVVVDEFGGAVGVITVEDILEEVVGDIEDEYDVEEKMYQEMEPGLVLLNGRMEVTKLNEIFQLDLPLGRYTTVSGFLIHFLRRIPKPDEKLFLRNYEFTIKKSTPRTIDEVLLRYKIDTPQGELPSSSRI